MSDGASFRARAAASLGLTDMVDAFGFASFRLYIITNFISLTGLWVQRIAIQALAWQLTHSASWLGIIALVDLAPALVFGPVAGAMADRFSRRRLTYVTQILAMSQATLLAVITVAGLIDIWILFTLTLAGGINTAFWGPVRQSIVPNMVPRRYLSTAVALGSVNFHLARFIGPAIAGPILLLTNTGVAFGVNAVSYLAFLVALPFIDIPAGAHEQRRKAGAAATTSLLADTVHGLGYVLRHRGFGPFLLVLFLGGTAIRPLIELLAGYADRVHGQGEGGFALLTAAMGAGALVASLWLAAASVRLDHFRAVTWSGVIAGAFLGATALLPTFTLAVLAVAIVSFGLTINGVSGQIVLQLAVPDAMRGRLLSFYTAIFRGTPALGALIVGVVADMAGFRWPLAVAGLLGVAIFAALSIRRERLAQHLGAAQPDDGDADGDRARGRHLPDSQTGAGRTGAGRTAGGRTGGGQREGGQREGGQREGGQREGGQREGG